MTERKRRFKPEMRKAQIIEVTKQLIIEKGLAWASVYRIAETLNITQATLYYHYKNRREILMETLKSVIDEIAQSISVDMDDVEEFIRQFSSNLYRETTNDPARARLFFELLCAPPDEDMREEIQKQLSGLHGILELAIQKGIQQGIFRADINAKLIGWVLMSYGITTFIGIMLDMPNFISLEEGMQSVEYTLETIRAPRRRKKSRQ